MTHSPKVPAKLLSIQRWFGKIVSQPLGQDHKIPFYTPEGQEIEKEAAEYLKASPTLQPHERIEIYHQQYWWRLLKCLGENFPFVLRLFGYEDFHHQIAIPYLSAYPPNHWALCRLGETLPEWIQKEYTGEERELVTIAARLDWACQHAFWSENRKPLISDQLLNKIILLQPSVHLFALRGNFFALREAFLKEEVVYWDAHPFPQISFHPSFFVLYRTVHNGVAWKEISREEYELLCLFKEGLTLEEICEKIEKKESLLLEEVALKLPFWFQEWAYLQWFGERDEMDHPDNHRDHRDSNRLDHRHL